MLTKFGHRNALPAGVMAVVALLLVAGCGDDGGGDQTQSLSIEATEPAKDSYRIEAPESIEAGVVDIEFKNSGKLEREAQFIKIDGDHTTEQALAAFDKVLRGGAAPAWFQARGGVGTTAPGGTATITQRLEPGSYMIIDSGEPEGQDVQPHYKQGAVAELAVTGDPSDADLPESDATITAAEYQFDPSGLKPGKNTIEFRNAGAQWHHLVVARMNPGATAADVKRFFETEKGEPPLEEENVEETAVIDGGEAQRTEVDLTPGNYALLCFIPDRSGGPPHIAKGMVTEATVPEE